MRIAVTYSEALGGVSSTAWCWRGWGEGRALSAKVGRLCDCKIVNRFVVNVLHGLFSAGGEENTFHRLTMLISRSSSVAVEVL